MDSAYTLPHRMPRNQMHDITLDGTSRPVRRAYQSSHTMGAWSDARPLPSSPVTV
jgi:hypothetical protein